MHFYKKFIAVLVTIAVLVSFLPPITPTVDAAGVLLVKIAPGPDGKPLLNSDSVTLRWEKIDIADSYDVSYRDENGALVKTAPSLLPEDYDTAYIDYKIENLKKDFIYQFKVTANLNTGAKLTFTKRVIVGITFDVTRGPQSAVQLVGGGKEIGIDPKLKFRWKIPGMWNNSDVESVGADGVLNTADDGAVVMYSDFDELDYDIYLGTDNDGLNRTQIKVRYSTEVNQYVVTRFKNDIIKNIAQSVNVDDDEPGYILFESLGVNDAESGEISAAIDTVIAYEDAEQGFSGNNKTDVGSIDANSIDLTKIYKNPDITPGAVLRMSIMPIFHDETGDDAVGLRRASVTNGYTYTPLRYRITKDPSNNLKILVYTVDKSGGDLASFTYDVQYGTTSDFENNPDYFVGASQSDKFVEGDNLTVFIENKDYDTPYFYRVVAHTANMSEKLESSIIEYRIAQDVSQAPLPEGLKRISVDQVNGSVENTFYGNPPDGNTYNNIKSANVKLLWNKPLNYIEMKNQNLYYHFLMSPVQDPSSGGKEIITHLFGDITKSDQYNVKYREIYKVNINACTLVDSTGKPTSSGDYLSYTIDGLKLFSTVDNNGTLTQNLTNNDTDSNGNLHPYPTYLMPNRIYYVKVYSQKDTNPPSQPSDVSLPISVTTPPDLQRSPASPESFGYIRNEILPMPDGRNSITLEWNKITFNLKDYTSNLSVASSVYYDLYMSDGIEEDSFELVGSVTEGVLPTTGDAVFSGHTNVDGRVINATITGFNSPAFISRFGSKLKPNFTYNFKVKSRIMIGGEAAPRESDFSHILSVTTLRGEVNPPDDSEKNPRTPTDFTVVKDASGNSIESNTATFTWTELEDDVKYYVIKTSRKLDSIDESITSIRNRSDYYTSREVLDPSDAPADNSNFTFDSTNKQYRLKVSELYPNTTYYFSLCAEKELEDGTTLLYSTWITVPITTTLIEMPESLDFVAGNEIGVLWNASTLFDPESFTVSVAEGGGSNFKVKPRGEVFISEEILPGGSRFYARIISLKPNTEYSIKITGTTNNGGNPVTFGPLTINNSQTETRDDKHQLDIKWVGKNNYKYEIAIKGEDEEGIIAEALTSSTQIKLSSLSSSSSGYYNGYNIEILSGKGRGQRRTITSYNGVTKAAVIDEPWSIIPEDKSQYRVYSDYKVLSENSGFVYMSKEKPAGFVGTDSTMYYARITSLKSDAKYYIKVRSISLNDLEDYTYSKYAGPITARTEFSQDDYDDKEQENNENTSYFDQVDKFKNTLYWVLGNSSSTYKIKIRGDKAENYISNDSSTAFTLDLLGESGVSRTVNEVYIPLSVVKLLDSENKNLIIKVANAEYILRPGTINYENSEIIEEIEDKTSVKGIYIHIRLDNLSKSSDNSLPYNTTLFSDINKIGVQIVGMSNTDAGVEKNIKDRLDRYIRNGISDLQSTSSSSKDTTEELNDVIEDIVEEIEDDLRDYIEDYIEGGSGMADIIITTEDIPEFDTRVAVKLAVTGTAKGHKSGYLYTDSSWKSVESVVSDSSNTVAFDILKPGKHVILNVSVDSMYNIPSGHWAASDIRTFVSKYDIKNVFGMYNDFDDKISVRDTVLIIEKILPDLNGTFISLQDKANKIGIGDVLNYNSSGRSINRQEMAALVMRVYELKTGMDTDNLKANKLIIINDNRDIKDDYYKAVELCVDMKILSLDANKNFKPAENVTGAQLITALTRILKTLGEL